MSEEKQEKKCCCKKAWKIVAILVIAYCFLVSTYTAVKLDIFNAQSQINNPDSQMSNLIGQGFKISKKYDKGQSYEKASKTGKPMVVFFYVDWCQYCRHFAPTFYKLTKDKLFKEHLVAAYVNCELPENQRLAQEYNIKGYPTVYFVKSNGERIHINNGKFGAKDAVMLLKQEFLNLAGVPPVVDKK